jgi:hypothetical protein
MSSQANLDGTMFEFALTYRRLRWRWCLRDRSGRVVMQGREKSRAEARYQSERALFLMLLATCRRVSPSSPANQP